MSMKGERGLAGKISREASADFEVLPAASLRECTNIFEDYVGVAVAEEERCTEVGKREAHASAPGERTGHLQEGKCGRSLSSS